MQYDVCMFSGILGQDRYTQNHQHTFHIMEYKAHASQTNQVHAKRYLQTNDWSDFLGENHVTANN